tara:strand:+ start:388 stop:1338 length:951 start_codon:yes stop_codon:yes gene_type:complete
VLSDCPLISSTHDYVSGGHSIRVVQYNVEWLFINELNGCPGDGCTWANQTESLTHLEHVANVIREINPDIVNLCEVEGCDELSMLIDEIGIQGFQPGLVQGTDTATGQNVAMITRIEPHDILRRYEGTVDWPLPNSTCGYTGSGGTVGVSKHYYTTFKVNGRFVAMIGAHLLAIPTDPERCAKREAQAYILHLLVSQFIEEGCEVILLGDFNDFDADIPDINSNIPTSRVLSILKGDGQLVSLGNRVGQNERFSDWWDSDGNCDTASSLDYSMIDHVLVSPWISTKITNVFVYHEYPEYCGKYDSDHYPVVMDLKL